MAGLIKSSLENLHAVLKTQDPSRNLKAFSLIQDIISFALEIPDKETG